MREKLCQTLSRAYCIKDGTQVRPRTLDDCVAGAIAAGVDRVQIREKDFCASAVAFIVAP